MINVTEEEFQNATAQGLVLVDLWAPWCGPCQQLAPELAKIDSEFEELIVAKVNMDQHPNVGRDLKIRGIPSLKLFKDGEIVYEATGFGASTIKNLRAALKENLDA